jgi:hypothetical protein
MDIDTRVKVTSDMYGRFQDEEGVVVDTPPEITTLIDKGRHTCDPAVIWVRLDKDDPRTPAGGFLAGEIEAV